MGAKYIGIDDNVNREHVRCLLSCFVVGDTSPEKRLDVRHQPEKSKDTFFLKRFYIENRKACAPYNIVKIYG
jgi:hypothetical protein